MRINFNKNLIVNRVDMGGGSTTFVTITGQTNFSTLPAGSLSSSYIVLTMPSGLSFTRNSPATVQYGTSLVGSGSINADVPVIGRILDSDSYGLQHEISGTNYFKDARDMSTANYTAGTATATYNYGIGPDGAQLADRFNATSLQFGSHLGAPALFVGVPAFGSMIFSTWQMPVTSSGPYQAYLNENSQIALAQGTFTGTAYKRLVMGRFITGSMNSVIPLDGRATGVGGTTALARDVIIDYNQLEAGGFATSAIPSSGSSFGQRAGSRIQYTSPLPRLSNGRFNLELDMRPLGSSTAYSSGSQAMRIWTDATNGSNFVEINSASLCVTMSISGVLNSTVNSLPPWNANDRLQLFFGVGGNSPSRVFAQVGTGSATELTISGSALGLFAPTGSIDLLSDGTTKQFSCWLVTERTYKGL